MSVNISVSNDGFSVSNDGFSVSNDAASAVRAAASFMRRTAPRVALVVGIQAVPVPEQAGADRVV